MDGELKVLNDGQQPLPGEVVIAKNDADSERVQLQLVNEDGIQDISDDVAQIIGALEQGQDPTLIGDEFAPAAGESNGSSLQASGTIDRIGAELLADTGFETNGLQALGLSQTQSLTLLEQFNNFSQIPVELNSRPIGANLEVVTDEDTPVSGKLTANDEDGDALTFNKTTDPTNGSVTVGAEGNWTYTPNDDYHGSDSFTVEVSDGQGGTDTITVNIGVTPVNDAPNIVDGNGAPLGDDVSVETSEDTPVSGKLNAADIDGDALTFNKTTDPTNGSVTVGAEGNWTYTPNDDYHGSDSFTVEVSDGQGGTDTITVNIGVTPVNDAPNIVDGNGAPLGDDVSIETSEDTPVSGKLNAADIDGDALTFNKTTDPTNGSVTVDADGNWTYTPNDDYHGSDSFTVEVSDGQGGTDTITVNIGVTPVNDAPNIVDGNGAPLGDDVSVETSEDTPVSGKLNAADIDGDALTFNKTTDPTNGSVTVDADGNWTYTPNDDYHGSDSFTVEVSDGQGGTDTITVNIGVTPVNDAPNIVDGNGAPLGDDVSVETSEDTPVSGKLNAADVDGDALTFNKTSDPTNGSVTVDADGNWTYTPNDDYHGSDSFTVEVSDGQGGTDTITVNIGVTPVNDAPEVTITQVENFVEDSGAADGSLVAKFETFDEDGDPVSVTLSDTVNYRIEGDTVVLTEAGAALVNSGQELPAFSLTPNDGKVDGEPASADLSVTAVNDAPEVTITQVENFVEDSGAADGSLVAKFETFDEDGDPVSVTLSDTVNYRIEGDTVVLTEAGAALVNSGQELPAFSLTPNDGKVDGEPASADPSVTAVNDAPEVTITQVENFVEDSGAADGSLVAKFETFDEDGDPVSVTLSDTVNYRIEGDTVVLTEAGAALVNSGQELPAFSLTPNDGKVDGEPASADPSVTAVNDAPEVTITQVENFVEDSDAADGSLVAKFETFDEDGDPVSVTLSDTENYRIEGDTVVLTEAGAALVNSGQELPAFSLTPNDGKVDGEPASADPSVTAVNDAPEVTITQVENFVEDSDAADGSLVAKFETFDEDGDPVSVTLSDTVNYRIEGDTVVLTEAGAALVNSGQELPAFSSDTKRWKSGWGTSECRPERNRSQRRARSDHHQVENFVEDSGAADGSLVAKFETFDEDGDPVSVTLSDTVNYRIEGDTVVLTEAGAALVNSGQELPAFSLTPNDGKVDGEPASADPSVTAVNDAPEVTITQVENFVEDSGAADGSLVAKFETFDEDGDPVSVTLSDTVNYRIEGDTVVLTEAGAALVNSGQELPAFSLTPNDGKVDGEPASADPSVTAVNDAPEVTITQVENFVEDSGAADGSLVAKFETFDEDGDPVSVTLSDTVNYRIEGDTVVLTEAGAALVNSGQELPAFSLTPNDGKWMANQRVPTQA
uniref:tandem-95 repeat protein n=1 Tax=Vibrio alfacsensis TaxID=1074311 RepID=UPI0013E2F76B|nr:Ig-like domain-containing protein [Vibrio alfacsensis]